MKLNNKALLTAGGIGAAVQILLAICGGLTPFAALAGTDAAITLVGPLGIVATVANCCGWIINLAIGFGYVYLAAKEDGSVQVADGAVGGAIATGVAAVIGGLLSACLMVVSPFVTLPSSDAATTALMASIAGVAIAICGGLFGGAIVGAIGGLIGALTIGKPKTA